MIFRETQIISFLNQEKVVQFKTKLQDNLKKCSCVKGTVAYWTIDTDFIQHLVTALKKKDSYYCVDIHLPTDIENLEKFNQEGCNLYLYLNDFSCQSPGVILSETRHLLHSKVILFEFNDHTVEIWIGSHNFTKAAITDFNIELSVMITTNKDDNLYQETLSFLNDIKNRCERFQSSQVSYYLSLQNRKIGEEWFVLDYLKSKNACSLQGNTIEFLIDDWNIFSPTTNLLSFKRKTYDGLLVIVEDTESRNRYYYKAVFKHIGEIDKFQEDTFKMYLEHRKYVEIEKFLFNNKIFELGLDIQEGDINAEKLKQYNYFALVELITQIDVEILNKSEKWNKQSQDSSEHLQRFANLSPNIPEKDLFLKKTVNTAIVKQERGKQLIKRETYLEKKIIRLVSAS